MVDLKHSTTTTQFFYKDYLVKVFSLFQWDDEPGNNFTWAIYELGIQEPLVWCDVEKGKTRRYAENVACAYVDHFLVQVQEGR